MAAKYQLITELYRRTGVAVAKVRRRGRAFCPLPAATINAVLTNSFNIRPTPRCCRRCEARNLEQAVQALGQ